MDPQETKKENQNIDFEKQTRVEADQSWSGKIFFVVIGLLIAGSVAAAYWRYLVKRDYVVQAQTDCDPETENCFIWQCNPESTAEGEACTGDEEKDIWYYKLVRRNAKNIPLCDPNEENCQALVCAPGEKDCSEELCSGENVPEGETCNDPVQYLIDNPPEEESVDCEDGDEECSAGEEATDEECVPDDQACLETQDSEESEESACPPDDKDCEQKEENDSLESSSPGDVDNSDPEASPEPM